MHRIFRFFLFASCLLLIGACRQTLLAQALPTATGPGAYISVGGGLSAFPSAYDNRNLGGYMAYADIQPQWHFGLEAEARKLRFNTDEGVDQKNYLIGVRTVMHPYLFHPYAKFLVGATEIDAPFGYGKGTFFTLVPGAGLECTLASRVTLRLLDFEYQITPDFIGSNVRKAGLSVGLSFRITNLPTFPKHAEFTH